MIRDTWYVPPNLGFGEGQGWHLTGTHMTSTSNISFSEDKQCLENDAG